MARLRTFAAIPLLSASLTVGACSGSGAPDKSNFREAIGPMVADAYCRPIDATRLITSDAPKGQPFPIVIAAQASDFDPGRSERVALETAATLGLMTRTAETVAATRDGIPEATSMQPVLRFEPTEKGRSDIRAVEMARRGGGTVQVASICLGRGEVVDVVRWTEPVDAFGHRVTQVTYTQRGVDPIEGASDEDRARLAETVERTVPLEKTSDGWRVMPR